MSFLQVIPLRPDKGPKKAPSFQANKFWLKIVTKIGFFLWKYTLYLKIEHKKLLLRFLAGWNIQKYPELNQSSPAQNILGRKGLTAPKFGFWNKCGSLISIFEKVSPKIQIEKIESF